MASLKKCIEEKCKDCIYDEYAPGTWREQSEACTVRSCPLWVVRPMTVATINLQRSLKSGKEDGVNSLIDSLPDEDEDAPVAVAA